MDLGNELGLHAYSFLAAGGTLAFSDWMRLDEEERMAFLVAGRQVQEERAKLVATAVRQSLHELIEQATRGA